MSLTSTSHRNIHYALCAINIIGIILLSIAIIVTYNRNHNNEISDKDNNFHEAHRQVREITFPPKICPKFVPLETDLEGVVRVVKSTDGTVVCLGTLINESIALISNDCVEQFDSKTEIRVQNLYTSNTEEVKSVIDVVPIDKFSLLFFEPFDETKVFVLPKYCKDNPCYDISGNSTLVHYYKGMLLVSEVSFIAESHCFDIHEFSNMDFLCTTSSN